jgi:excisionase family DNA binding protein
VTTIVIAAQPIAVSFKTAGQLIEMSEQTVRRMVDDGEIASVWIKGKRRVPVSSLAQYVEENKQEA